MIPDELVAEIRAHAGLGDDPFDPTTVSGALAMQDGDAPSVDPVLALLQRVNIELNGPRPSETIGGPEQVIPAQLAYAVAEVARMLRDDGHADLVWAVDTAWLAVLAGDIDDVVEHVALERRARNL